MLMVGVVSFMWKLERKPKWRKYLSKVIVFMKFIWWKDYES